MITKIKNGKWPHSIRILETNSFKDKLKGKLRNLFGKNKPITEELNQKNRREYPCGVYIFLYHSIVGDGIKQEYEKYFNKVNITESNFKSQILYLLKYMEPITFKELEELDFDDISKPYFIISFDDGYENVLRNTYSFLDNLNIKPAVFVNGSFASRENCHYRALQFILHGEGFSDQLISTFREHYKNKDISLNNISHIIKNEYEYEVTSRLITDTYFKVFKTTQLPRVHLNWEEIKFLSDNGWEIGNHTYSHPLLSKLNYEQQKHEIEYNDQLIKEKGLNQINWLSIPIGRSSDINRNTLKWLTKSSTYNALFVSGGYNVRRNRTEWLRIGCGDHGINAFKTLLDSTIKKMSKLGYNIK